MTLVDADTGEVVQLDAAAAERRAERITLRLDAIADNYRAVLPMIREAIEKRDDLALGYRSPGDYISDRFGQSLTGLGIEVRRSVVAELTEAGLSTRAIAPVVGVSHEAVRKDQRAVNQLTPATEPEVESRFKGATAPKPAPPTPSPKPPTPVTGIDGKNYTRSSKSPRRPALTADSERARSELLKAVERVERLAGDDRFPANREQVAAVLRGPLAHAIKVLTDLLDGLATGPQEDR